MYVYVFFFMFLLVTISANCKINVRYCNIFNFGCEDLTLFVFLTIYQVVDKSIVIF